MSNVHNATIHSVTVSIISNYFILCIYISLHKLWFYCAKIAQLVQGEGYKLDDVRLKSQQEQEILLFSTTFQLILWPIQMYIWQVPWALTLVIKQQWYESENSPPHSAEVKNEWIYTSTLPYMPSWCVPGQLEVIILWNDYGWVVTILRTCGYDHNCIESSSKKPKISSTKCGWFTKTKFAKSRKMVYFYTGLQLGPEKITLHVRTLNWDYTRLLTHWG